MTTENPTAKPSLFTPFNVVVGIIILLGAVITFLRFSKGLGAVTNLSDNNPWGVWISFDLLCGVALAAGGYTTSAACYVFGLKRYHSAVRPAILTAFLGYSLVVFALNYDVGRPWRLPYPIFVQSGTTSVLFEVGLCVFLYLITLFVEWTPAALEWLGFRKHRNIIVRGTLALTIFGVVLSTMHQSSLGALYLIAPSKLHPLWYSTLHPGLLLHFEHRRRAVHGDLRGDAVAPFPARQDGQDLPERAQRRGPGLLQGRLHGAGLLPAAQGDRHCPG